VPRHHRVRRIADHVLPKVTTVKTIGRLRLKNFTVQFTSKRKTNGFMPPPT